METKVVDLFVKSISGLIKVNSDIKFNKANFLFEVELNCLKNNSKELQIKIDYYKRTIEGLQSEINQLENNLGSDIFNSAYLSFQGALISLESPSLLTETDAK